MRRRSPVRQDTWPTSLSSGVTPRGGVWRSCCSRRARASFSPGGQGLSPYRLHTLCIGMARRGPVLEARCARRGARCCRPVSRRRPLAAAQIAARECTGCTPGTGELDPPYPARSVHRSRRGLPPRLACAPAAGSAGCAGARAGLTRPQRRTSAATAAMSGGTAGLGRRVPARSTRSVNTRGGSRARWPASATSTTLPSTPRPPPEESPVTCPDTTGGR